MTSVSFVELQGPYSWADQQGLVRITMLRGSVDVNGAYFIAAPNALTYCPVTVVVPEPTALFLLGIGSLMGASVLRRRVRTAKSAPAEL